MKASAFRRWPVAGAYSPEQTTRLTGGSDCSYALLYGIYVNNKNKLYLILDKKYLYIKLKRVQVNSCINAQY